MTIETKFLGAAERGFDEAFFLDMYKEAKKELERHTTDMNSFINSDKNEGPYTKEDVNKDREYVKQKKEEFRKSLDDKRAREKAKIQEMQRLAIVFEYLFFTQAESAEWLGPDAMTIKCSDYDDIANGIDTLIEFWETETATSYMGIAVDVTIKKDLEKKLERTLKEISVGKLSCIKYFSSEKSNFKGMITKIPRLTICVDPKTVKDLARLKKENKNKELGNHPIQFQILEEILMQLEFFEKYAREIKKEEIAEILKNLHTFIKNLTEKKQTSTKDTGERDEGFKTLSSHLNYLKDQKTRATNLKNQN